MRTTIQPIWPFVTTVLLAMLCAAASQSGRAQTAEAGAAAASASTSSSAELQEVVVTAERRTERLMDVPMSVQAFSPEALDQKGLHNIDDLSRVAPGVTFLRNGMSASGNYNDEDSDVSIRGIDKRLVPRKVSIEVSIKEGAFRLGFELAIC
jgi:outer membrane receptor protein involved in Fe transport